MEFLRDEANAADSREESKILEISLRCIVKASDWDRFTFYARPVRSFKDGHVSRERSVVYDILATTFQHGTIFPRLEILDWFSIDLAVFHHVYLFLSPGITSFHINFDFAPNSPIFAILPGKLPRLKHISICGFSGFIPNSTISQFICVLRDLETLVIGARNLDLQAFEHLSRLPRLRYLLLMSTEVPPLSPRPTDVPSFRALRVFECESVAAAPMFLQRTGRSLVEFRIFVRCRGTCPTKRNLEELYAALGSSCTHTLLEKITVQSPPNAQPINPAQLELYVVSGDDLRKLFCFRNLVHVSLEHIVAVDMDDAVAVDMARAWPCIEVLASLCDTTHRITPRMTLEGVSAFAQHCPLLRRLSILFDATVVPKSKLPSGGTKQPRVTRFSQDRLTLLNVTYSSIGTKKQEWRRVAEFLRLIFPKLDEVRAADAQALAMRKAWKEVSDELL
ncbi:hypothetical protein FB45DRAFT_1038169 [Roridomyces roridus]|uniref:F-box domain-containing protein n=1 Tax=Roridomyces roridus TaxID=1738132 RepID=A0AAD7B4A6_9AGAR|nr:hypothetical protein FB45DRAFT_1038169 [Roridomyces roridus]